MSKNITSEEKEKLFDSKGFCVMPFVHSCIWPDGRVIPCCINQDTVFGNSKITPIEEIYSNKNSVLREFRKSMIKNILPNTCYRCKNLEDLGAETYRIGFNKRYKNIADQFDFDIDGNLYNHKIFYWDVRLSNICNLTCRMCDPNSSSKVAVEWMKDKRWNQNILQEPFNSFDNFLEFFKIQLPNIEEFYFAGGEPLMIRNHYKILETIINEGYAEKVFLRYNSNMTILGIKKYNVIDYWKHFPNLMIQCSIDGSKDTLNYIRYGASWDNIVTNIKIIRNNINCHLELFPTVQILNIFDVIKMHKDFYNEGIDFNSIHYNILTDPPYFDINVLNNILKEKAIVEWNDYKNWLEKHSYNTNKAQDVINYINIRDDSHLTILLLQELEKLDKKRNQNYKDIFPWLSF